jgi:glycosyltransferase involved in cell wall biosynthesis
MCQIVKTALKFGVPYTFLTDQNIDKKYPWPFSSWEKMSVRSSSGWAGCGQQVVNVQKERGYPHGNNAVLPHAVDIEKFKLPTGEERQSIQKKWLLKGPVLGYVGRFVPEKGIELILNTLNRLDPGIFGGVVFLGSGPLEKKIINWGNRPENKGRVHVELVRHGDMPDFLPGIDILICGSQTQRNWKEQLGRMLIEAMACGIPIVASDSGEIPITVGDAGLIFPERSPDEAAAKITRLIKDHGLYLELSKNALERSLRFSSENLAKEFLDFWRKAFLR